jgi:hypothetical protein
MIIISINPVSGSSELGSYYTFIYKSLTLLLVSDEVTISMRRRSNTPNATVSKVITKLRIIYMQRAIIIVHEQKSIHVKESPVVYISTIMITDGTSRTIIT